MAEARRAHARTHRRTPADAEIPAAAERSIGGATRNAAAASRLSATLKYLSIPPPLAASCPLPAPACASPIQRRRDGGGAGGEYVTALLLRNCLRKRIMRALEYYFRDAASCVSALRHAACLRHRVFAMETGRVTLLES